MAKIILRHKPAATWTSENPVLELGRMGIEETANPAVPHKFKIGNGVSAWNDLPYFSQDSQQFAIVARGVDPEQSAMWVLVSDGYSEFIFIDDIVFVTHGNQVTSLTIAGTTLAGTEKFDFSGLGGDSGFQFNAEGVTGDLTPFASFVGGSGMTTFFISSGETTPVQIDLTSVPNLEQLTIQGSGFTQVDLALTPKLTHINFDGASGMNDIDLSYVPLLQVFSADQSGFTVCPDLTGLVHLTDLSIDTDTLSTTPANLTAAPALVNVSFRQATFPDVPDFSALVHLEAIRLAGAQVTDPPDVHTLSKIAVIELDDTAISTSAAIDAFYIALNAVVPNTTTGGYVNTSGTTANPTGSSAAARAALAAAPRLWTVIT